MQALKFIIQGSYYDSQIYSGRLYLWSNEGTIITVDWNNLIDSVNVEDRLKLALRCGFQQSEYLYHDDFKVFVHDEDIKRALKQKFKDLSEKKIEFSESYLKNSGYIIAEQNNPFPFPHADSHIYNNRLYVGAPSGISESTLTPFSHLGDEPMASESTKLWDGPSLGIAASYSTLALAAGSEGLFELPLYDSSDYLPRTITSYDSSSIPFSSKRIEAYQINQEHSISARWMYASVFSSSYLNKGYLAYFTVEKEEAEYIQESEERYIQESEERKIRKLREIVPSSSIFNDQLNNDTTTYTWGVQDKICLASRNQIRIVQYSPHFYSSKNRNKRFKPLGDVNTELLRGEIVSGDSALFGFIVELDDGLLVVDSEMETSNWLPGEPVNWRIFPKSKSYTNQLHVIYEGYLCIYSFNQDYFVDQSKKRVGLRHSTSYSRAKRSTHTK